MKAHERTTVSKVASIARHISAVAEIASQTVRAGCTPEAIVSLRASIASLGSAIASGMVNLSAGTSVPIEVAQISGPTRSMTSTAVHLSSLAARIADRDKAAASAILSIAKRTSSFASSIVHISSQRCSVISDAARVAETAQRLAK